MAEKKRFLFLDSDNPQSGEFAQLLRLVDKQIYTRENFDENESPSTLTEFIDEEVHELKAAVELEMPAVEVASEIGDVLFLTFKLCARLGIDPRDALEMKILRNSLKYNDMSNSVGDYQTGRDQSKQIWRGMGGDAQFYRMYEELFDYDKEEVEKSIDETGIIFEAKEPTSTELP